MKRILSLSVALGLSLGQLPEACALTITDEEFQALKDLVHQQGRRLDQLEQAHDRDLKTIEQDRKLHQEDQQEIEKLKQQLMETQKSAAEAQQKADAASQVQPVHPLPPTPPATHNFTMVGDAEVQFGKVDGSHGAFALADFAPIFLFRARDNILFEAGLDITLQNNAATTASGDSHDNGAGTSVDLSFATIDYLFSDYATFVGGLMLLPLGTYSERSAGWLNKIPDDPLPRDLVPANGVGAQFRGAIPVGAPGESLAWSVYAANGPSSTDGTANHDQLDLGGNVGIKSDGGLGNLHGAPAFGGRIGWFKPWLAHYDVELGISGQTGKWDDAGQHRWSAAVLDGALHLGSNIEVKGEFIQTWLDTADQGGIRPHGWWVQGGYKLAGLNLDAPFLNNLELVTRYDVINDGTKGVNTHRWTLGYVYYFTNTLLFEGDYEFLNSNDPEEDHNAFVFQLSYGF